MSYFEVERLRGMQDEAGKLAEATREIIKGAPLEPIVAQKALRAALRDFEMAIADLEDAALALAPPQPKAPK